MVDTGRGFKEEDANQDVKIKKAEPVITPDGTEGERKIVVSDFFWVRV